MKNILLIVLTFLSLSAFSQGSLPLPYPYQNVGVPAGPVDFYYRKTVKSPYSNTPYTSLSQAKSILKPSVRYTGMTFFVMSSTDTTEYWMRRDTTWAHIEKKLSGSLTNGNATTANGSAVDLGGTATAGVDINMIGQSFNVHGTSGGKSNSISFSNAGGVSISSGGSSSSDINLYSQNSGGTNHTQIDMAPTAGLLEGDKWELSGTALTIPSTNSITSKGYVLGAKTFTGKQTFAASATGGASINIPSGTAPTSPADGDTWQASNHLYTRLNGVTYQLDQQVGGGGSGTVTTVTGTSPIIITSTPTITPNVTISQASASTNGYLSSTDWTIFNNKKSAFNSIFLSPGQALNTGFIILASAIVRPANSPVYPTNPITWEILEHTTNHNSSFYDTISGDTDGSLLIDYPTVKSVMNLTITDDESFASAGMFVGPSVGLTDAHAFVYQNRPRTVALTGDGAGGWTKTGDFTSDFTVTGYGTGTGTSFNVANFNDYPGISIDYIGPNNWGVQRFYSGLGSYNVLFALRDRFTGQFIDVLPGTTDQIIISAGVRPKQILTNNWNVDNAFMTGPSSFVNFWITGLFEAWMVIAPSSATSAKVQWQSYPSATGYKIYRDTHKSFCCQTLVHTGTDNEFTDTGLTTGTTYYYKMVATVSSVDQTITTFRVIPQ